MRIPCLFDGRYIHRIFFHLPLSITTFRLWLYPYEVSSVRSSKFAQFAQFALIAGPYLYIRNFTYIHNLYIYKSYTYLCHNRPIPYQTSLHFVMSTSTMARSRRETSHSHTKSTLATGISGISSQQSDAPEKWRTRGHQGRFIPLYLPNSRKCSDCGKNSTKQWRRDVDGKLTLCNACGIRARRRPRNNNSSSNNNNHGNGGAGGSGSSSQSPPSNSGNESRRKRSGNVSASNSNHNHNSSRKHALAYVLNPSPEDIHFA